ncbi:hypothetical protein GX48_06879 [Paracoccidioides brasiliensis]|nr:hypothetical protein GX48_06879 [Paracoccidioides brasiliensis]
MSSASEPSLLEYARFHNIANSSILDPSQFIQPAVEDIDPSFDDIIQIPSIDLSGVHSEIKAISKEKLDFSWTSAPLLVSIIKSTAESKYGEPNANRYGEDEYLPDFYQIRNLKEDTPMLRIDHELDVQSFRQKISLHAIEINLPLEHVNDENDEGLKFPAVFWLKSKQLREISQGEKLDCTKEVLIFLQEIKVQILKARQPASDDWLDEEIICYGKRKEIDPQTPILLPRDRTKAPFIPSSPYLELEILSEPITPPVPGYQDIESQQLEATPVRNSHDVVRGFLTGTNGGVYPELLSGISNKAPQAASLELSLDPLVRNSMKDFKVETPIAPPVSTKKRYAENDEEITNAMARSGVLPEWSSCDEIEIENGDLVENGLEEIASAAKKITDDKHKNELIKGIGISTRCEVPILKSPHTFPPWPLINGLSESELKDLYHAFISKVKQEHLIGSHSFHYQRGGQYLKWVPFAVELRRLDVNESIGPMDALDWLYCRVDLLNRVEDEVEKFMPDFPHDSRLSNLDDKEEPSRACREIERPVSSIVRHALFTAINEPKRSCPQYQHANNLGGVSQKRAGSQNFSNIRLDVENRRAERTRFSKISPLDSLSNFMEVRGHNLRASRPDVCPYFSHPAPPELPVSASSTLSPGIGAHLLERSTQLGSHATSIPTLAFPSTIAPLGALTFVISTSLLQTHRAIIHNLESLSPPCHLFFRDSKAASPRHPQLFSQVQGHSTDSPSDEPQIADISISPAAGVILTTTQDILQKYLPGHQPHHQGIVHELNSPIRQRISNVCLLYEELYVIICNHINSPKQHASEIGMNVSTMNAVDSLRAFCDSLNHFTTVTVSVVMADPNSLTNWLVSAANRYHVSSRWSPANPITGRGESNQAFSVGDASPHELLLRQMGLNPFAALMALFYPFEERKTGDDLGYDRSFLMNFPTKGTLDMHKALARFVGMNPLERKRIFAPIFGQRVLERVERRLGVEER